ncbi:hypothetical protein F5B21DRAFT_231677 [Xylaria acuta]|nr:hypothetical protein F5B21DRAFT_231677 [Xylaria acuta]
MTDLNLIGLQKRLGQVPRRFPSLASLRCLHVCLVQAAIFASCARFYHRDSIRCNAFATSLRHLACACALYLTLRSPASPLLLIGTLPPSRSTQHQHSTYPCLVRFAEQQLKLDPRLPSVLSSQFATRLQQTSDSINQPSIGFRFLSLCPSLALWDPNWSSHSSEDPSVRVERVRVVSLSCMISTRQFLTRTGPGRCRYSNLDRCPVRWATLITDQLSRVPPRCPLAASPAHLRSSTVVISESIWVDLLASRHPPREKSKQEKKKLEEAKSIIRITNHINLRPRDRTFLLCPSFA